MSRRRRRCNISNFHANELQNIPQNFDKNNSNCFATQDNCECGFDAPMDSIFPENVELAQSYVPWQIMSQVFTPEVGLRMGTIFPELVTSYVPGQATEEKYYLQATNPIKGGCNDV